MGLLLERELKRALRWRRAFWILAICGAVLACTFPVCWAIRYSRDLTFEQALTALKDPKLENPVSAAGRLRVLMGQAIEEMQRHRDEERIVVVLDQLHEELGR